jgi:predicted DCC family thiol-disulfide oxidoreductase YuxK
MIEKTEVLYNGACPVCSREIGQYAELSKHAALPIEYADLQDAARLADWGVSEDQAARRFHVRKHGQVLSGLPAFIVLWEQIPQTRLLARLLNLPGVHWGAAKLYDHIAAPLLFVLHQRKQSKLDAKAATLR